jgi:hypothetical protein
MSETQIPMWHYIALAMKGRGKMHLKDIYPEVEQTRLPISQINHD